MNPVPLRSMRNVDRPVSTTVAPVITGIGFNRLTEIEPETLLTSTLVADIVAELSKEIVAGAAYTPAVEMTPIAEFPPVTPLTDQMTELSSKPVADAVNVVLDPARMLLAPWIVTEAVSPMLAGAREIPQPTPEANSKMLAKTRAVCRRRKDVNASGCRTPASVCKVQALAVDNLKNAKVRQRVEFMRTI
jgi:hypothetical protein